jgi:glucose/arabinose dehydrogenase
METRRIVAVGLGTLGLVASSLLVTQAPTSATAAETAPESPGARAAATVPAGFRNVSAIGGLSEPVSVAFAPDGTAFVALKTGVVKSFDPLTASQAWEGAATATDFADLSTATYNFDDLGMTGIAVDPQFPARPYVYVNYTYNRDPRDNPPVVPKWVRPGEQYDACPTPASLDPVATGCPVMARISRLTAVRGSLGWQLQPGSELPLVTAGCFQFGSHGSGDVAFGPDGRLYASAGDGASFRGTDYGQANNPCGDPTGGAGINDNEGGSLRAQDQRTGGDPLGVGGTIFRLDPDAALNPAVDDPDGWLVAMGQRNPWRLNFRQGKEQLWSVDVGSSNWEEINYLVDAPSTGFINRGWPCYEGTTGQSLRNAAWDALDMNICEGLYAAGVGAVQAPVFAYRTRTGATPLTPGENCPVSSSSMSGVAFSALGSSWPAGYQDRLFFSDFLRGCIWTLGKTAAGQPDPASVTPFVQGAGAVVDLTTGPGGDLYYVDYGTFTGDSYVAGSGGIHRIAVVDNTSLRVQSRPAKVKIKVDGQKHKGPYVAEVATGTVVKLKAPRSHTKKGVRWVFSKWKGVAGKKAKRKRKLTITLGATDVSVKAVYQKVRTNGR